MSGSPLEVGSNKFRTVNGHETFVWALDALRKIIPINQDEYQKYIEYYSLEGEKFRDMGSSFYDKRASIDTCVMVLIVSRMAEVPYLCRAVAPDGSIARALLDSFYVPREFLGVLSDPLKSIEEKESAISARLGEGGSLDHLRNICSQFCNSRPLGGSSRFEAWERFIACRLYEADPAFAMDLSKRSENGLMGMCYKIKREGFRCDNELELLCRNYDCCSECSSSSKSSCMDKYVTRRFAAAIRSFVNSQTDDEAKALCIEKLKSTFCLSESFLAFICNDDMWTWRNYRSSENRSGREALFPVEGVSHRPLEEYLAYKVAEYLKTKGYVVDSWSGLRKAILDAKWR